MAYGAQEFFIISYKLFRYLTCESIECAMHLPATATAPTAIINAHSIFCWIDYKWRPPNRMVVDQSEIFEIINVYIYTDTDTNTKVNELQMYFMLK